MPRTASQQSLSRSIEEATIEISCDSVALLDRRSLVSRSAAVGWERIKSGEYLE